MLQTGCQSAATGIGGGDSPLHAIKTQGVYTTLNPSERSLDLPGTAYIQKSVFGPGETPAGVIIGYGVQGRQESVTLKLSELSTERVLMTKDYYATYGKVILQPLAIRLSGDYRLTLLLGGTERDAYRFSVTRRDSILGAAPNGGYLDYAQGQFGVSIEHRTPAAAFNDFDEKLNYTLLRAMNLESKKTSPDFLAQRTPGNVVIRCRMNSEGQISNLAVQEHTLDNDLAEMFEKVLLRGSPYGKLPGETAHTESDQELKIMFEFR